MASEKHCHLICHLLHFVISIFLCSRCAQLVNVGELRSVNDSAVIENLVKFVERLLNLFCGAVPFREVCIELRISLKLDISSFKF